MIRRFGFFLLTLPVAAAFSAAPALAQYYSSPPPGYYRSGPPPGAYYEDRGPPPAFWSDDEDDDQPVRRTYRSPQMSQMPPQGQSGRLPYPDQAERAAAAARICPAARRSPPVWASARPAGAGRRSAGREPRSRRGPPAGRHRFRAGRSANAATPAPPAGTAALPPEDQPEQGQPKELSPNLKRQLVDFNTREPAGTIIVDTAHTYLYLVLGGGKAIRYGVRVGREGFTWTGTERISKMKEWPDWFPPSEMIERQPYLPRVMAGGPGNPLGARAMYLGNTLYRIHGTNQPSTIGHYVSSGCVGMLNEDVEDLYSRVQVGTRVVVLPGKAPETVANTGSRRVEPANPMAPPPRSGTAVSASPLPPAR